MPVLPQRERGGGEAPGRGAGGVRGAAPRASDGTSRREKARAAEGTRACGRGMALCGPGVGGSAAVPPGSSSDPGRAARSLAARHTCTRRRPAFVAEPRAAAAGLGPAEASWLPVSRGRGGKTQGKILGAVHKPEPAVWF